MSFIVPDVLDSLCPLLMLSDEIEIIETIPSTATVHRVGTSVILRCPIRTYFSIHSSRTVELKCNQITGDDSRGEWNTLLSDLTCIGTCNIKIYLLI